MKRQVFEATYDGDRGVEVKRFNDIEEAKRHVANKVYAGGPARIRMIEVEDEKPSKREPEKPVKREPKFVPRVKPRRPKS